MTASEPPSSAASRPLAELSVGDELVWAVVDAAPDALVMVDELGTIELVNCRTEELFGYDRTELLGRPVELLVPEGARGVHRAHRTRYRADPTPREMGAGSVLQGRRADGSTFPVEVSLSPVSAGDGRRILAAVRDVSHRLAAERDTRMILHALDTALDGLFVLDPSTLQFIYVNNAGCGMHGYAPEEMIGMTPLHIAPELDEAGLRGELEALLAGRIDTVTFRTTGLRRNGEEFPVEVLVNHPEAEPPQTERTIVAVVRDMTERVRMEQALADSRATEEVLNDRERMARNLHDMVIGDLFGVGLGLQATAGILQDDDARRRVLDAVSSLDEIIGKLRETILGVRLGHRPAAGVEEMVRDQLAGFGERLASEPALTIEGDIEAVEWGIVEQLLPTIREALTNVTKHAGATRTTVDITVTDDELVLRIADDGIGSLGSGPANRGFGQANMRERAEVLGGLCLIGPGEDRGLVVSWSVPRS